MKLFSQDPTLMNARRREALREVCKKSLAEPARIWDLLEARGIDVTPGVIFQAMNDLKNSPQEPTAEDRRH
jgi:hypothetical protein